MKRERLTSVFLQYWDAADAETREAGLQWYARAEVIVRRWARIYNQPITVVAGIVAVLSQRQRWASNLLQAERCLQGLELSGIFSLCAEKAEAIRDAHDLDSVRGPKVSAFYRAILGDTSSVVLDSWMIYAVYPNRRSLSVKQYEALAEVLRAEAASIGIEPALFQAVVWCQIRGSYE
jgi:hypothetical protein